MPEIFSIKSSLHTFQHEVPKTYWGGVILTTTHLINRLPSRVLSFKSPMDILSLFYPNIRTTNHLIPKIFGIFLNSKGVQVLPSTFQKGFVSADVPFNEISSLVSYQVSVLVPQFSEPPISLPHFSEPESWPLEPAPKNRMTGQVYSRKKVAIPKL
ncbi:hypothetical protein CK203_104233 [Vitis vinifera]|uniref:Retrovirus-related Pol polyprotein from transposon RE1 n=1 Tax=Vitis vinifera TaxID=29760 RepID=A0A438FFY7_VITVI|nr:hypothetical protein CK203_104233 [Vitis vinifera]